MKKVLFSVATLIGSVFVFLGLIRLLPDGLRDKFSRLPAIMMKRMMELMPDE